MKNLKVFIILLLLIACIKADDEKTLDMLKLRNGSVLLGDIISKDSGKYEIRIYGKPLTIEMDSVVSIIENIPDPNQFSFPNVLPGGTKKWEIPVYWLKEQLLQHEIRGIETFEIAVHLKSGKLYLKGFGQPDITMPPDTTLKMFQIMDRIQGYFEKIPPDKDN